MRPALFSSDPSADREGLRRRAISIALTILAHVLLLLMLLRLAPEQFGKPGRPGLTTVSLLPATEETAKRASAQKAARKGGQTQAKETPPQPNQPKPPPPPPPLPSQALDILPMSREEMAAADISKIQAPPGRAAGTADSGDAAASASGDTPAVGSLHGQPLYAAEWYRQPTDAELAFYLPRNRMKGSWGEIACRTAPRFHVEDCEELGDSPGSGLARAWREAAWQFLVRPPRVGGKTLVGTWVRIRIDITEPPR